MRKFADIEKLAAGHKGGQDKLETLLSTRHPGQQSLKDISDDRLLALFSQHVFSTGLNWTVIEKKWPGFEDVFHGFDPRKLAMLPDEAYEAMLSDARIVRHGSKIMATRDNAIWFTKLAKEHDSAAKFFADWPASDQIGLMDVMKRDGARLGGNVGTYSLRHAGKDGFILTRDVCAALVRAGVVDKAPTSKRDLAAVQAAFNHWHEETGRPYAQLSRILAMSVG
jgi:3-methyladenine DNA glycosylase Tag